MVKKNLELIGNKPNLFSFSDTVIDTFKTDETDKILLKSVIELFSKKAKSHLTYQLVDRHINNGFRDIEIIKMTKYPLAIAFNEPTKTILINISALGKRSISSIEPRDLYAMIVYGEVFSRTLKFSMSRDNSDIVSNMISAIILKTFSKKYGLSGSFFDLIPELRFLTNVYVLVSLFGIEARDAYKVAAVQAKYDVTKSKVDLDSYDFMSIKQFIHVLNESGTLPGINVYNFISIMVKTFQVINLPMFEDLSRFYATMYTSTINGNIISSPHLQGYNQEVYKKVISSINTMI